MSNKEDVVTINSYVEGRSAPGAGAPEQVIKRWETYRAQWRNWFPGVISSWYVSDSDLMHGKALRNSMMWNQNPSNWKDSTGGHAEDIAVAMSSGPDKPGMKKGLVPSQYMSKDGIMALQRRINAAGYRPPLKVDGKYGEGTKKGERWLRARESGGGIEYAAKDAAKQFTKQQPVATAPKPGVATVTKAADAAATLTAKPPLSLFGIPIGIKSLAAAAAGTAVGWFAGGPIGAAIGIPVGFVGSKLIPEKKP